MSSSTTTVLLVINLLMLFGVLAVVAVLFRKLRFLTRVALNTQKRQQAFLKDTFPQACEEREKSEIIAAITHDRVSQLASKPPVKLMSQFGEDLLLNRFFEGDSGVYFEAGAYDGMRFSNTYMLAKRGWKGLLVEPHPKMVEICRQHRPESIVEHCALSDKEDAGSITFTQADDERGGAALSFMEADGDHLEFCEKHGAVLTQVEVPLRTLNQLLDGRFDKIDFFSLDVEGMEMSVLRGFDIARYQPKVFLIEMKELEHNNEVTTYLKSFGYQPCAQRGCNIFFVHAPHVDNFKRCISESDAV